MRKTLLILAFGLFLGTSSANACDGAKNHACSKGKHTKLCTIKDGKDCSKDPNCVKDMKASKHHKKNKPQG